MTTFTNARLIDPAVLTDEIGWLTIENGTITARGTGTPPAAQTKAGDTVDCGGKCLAPGIVDLGVKVSEPGERHKESFASAGRAAAAAVSPR